MALAPGQVIELSVEKPASGGRMIARHDGEVVFVAGAIPGERVRARITRAEKQIAFADTETILATSPDRRPLDSDPACGGCVYAHIDYARQVQLKAELIRDAFVRIGRIPLEQSIHVRSGPERGYRMRARFHARDGRCVFYREHTHEPCDPRQTGQLSDAAADVVDGFIASVASAGVTTMSIELAENIAADQRAVHVDVAPSDKLERALERAVDETSLTGATASTPQGVTAAAGDPIVSDTLADLTQGRAIAGVLRRHPQSFFQGNRFLVSSLVTELLDAVGEGPIVDLYAGVGLFSIALAACGHAQVTAVEGSAASVSDLERNAAQFAAKVQVRRGSVEDFLRRPSVKAGTLIVDPPRTGMSKAAAEAIARLGAPRVVYVSCDAPTMARDARRLLDAGYGLSSLQGFDLFPNTAHVESLAVFDREPTRT